MLTKWNIQIKETQISGQSSGNGTPIIFLHAGVADKRMWQKQMEYFSDNYQTIIYDRRGFGETTTTNESYSHVDDLEHIITEFHIHKAILVGCSQGGRIAIDFALTHIQKVLALVLVAPAISGFEPEGYSEEILELIAQIEQAEKEKNTTLINEIEAHVWLDGVGNPGRVTGEKRELFLDMNQIALKKQIAVKEKPTLPAYEHVSKITVPTLIVHGNLDVPFVQTGCQYLLKKIANSKEAKIPDTAHLPNLEKPEFFNAILNDFFNTVK